MTRRRLPILLLILALLLSGCGGGRPDAPTITVYSPNGLGAWYATQFARFTADTGIKVTLFEAGSGEVVSRVNSRAVWEGLDPQNSVPPADLLVTLPPFIQKAAKAGLLQPSGVDTAGITSPVKDAGGLYVPIVGNALCFIANPAASPPPATWDDLLRPDLQGRLQYSTPGDAGDGTAMLLLLQHLMGPRGALDYLARLQTNNVGPSASTSVLQPKVSSGELWVANGDVQMNLASIRAGDANVNIFFPAMPDGVRTTVAVPYVAGVTASSKYPEQAARLLAFLLSEQVQRTVLPDASGLPVLDSVARQAPAAAPGQRTPSSLLEGVQVWTPDWEAVLAGFDADLAAYRDAVR